MHENLILLGAGATAAVSNGRLPTAENFFTSNSEWSAHISDFPHLALAYNKVEHLKNESADKKPVTLTDVWLFIDTLNKYHLVIASNNYTNIYYNDRLLKLRYEEYGQDLPYYLTSEYLNNKYIELCDGMRPLFSTLNKQIYCIFPRENFINYFLILAGWELKFLNYKTYGPHKDTNDLYVKLLYGLKQKNFSVINFNWDVYFENACKNAGFPLKLSVGDVDRKGNAIYLCKPHGGWNIRHIDRVIEPMCNLGDHIEDPFFDKTEKYEERPAMIPYFMGPDEISEEHRNPFPQVSMYFLEQQQVMKEMFEKAKKIVSIGYSFSKDDRHVVDLIKCIDNRNKKRLLCILKDDDEGKNRIKNIWEYNDGTNNFDYQGNGFNGNSAEKIASWMKNE